MSGNIEYMQNKNFVQIVGISGVILLVVLALNIFTEDWRWNFFDFVVAGILLVFLGSLISFFMKKFTKFTHRFIAVAIVIFLFLILWAELAVGIFGSPLAGS